MSNWMGAGMEWFQCDYCDKKSDVAHSDRWDEFHFSGDVPDGWWFLRLSTFVFESDSGETRHFCSKEHAMLYLKEHPTLDRTSDEMVI
jgi:hypothetical protein